MEKNDTGLLLSPVNIKLHRQYFKEMTRLIGINVIYKAPKTDKHYNEHGELNSNYYDGKLVGCIFDEHPTNWTMKKLGWNSELQEEVSIIHVPYDLEHLQVGALFIVPSGLDNAEGRVFRLIKMGTISVYPASIACQIAPVWENTFDKTQLDFTSDDFTLLSGEGENK